MSDLHGQVTPPAPATGRRSIAELATLAGRAARVALIATGLLAVASGGLAVRLAAGPLHLPGLVRQLANARLNGGKLALGDASLTWLWNARQAPLELTLRHAVLTRADGSVQAAAEQASIAVLPGRLLIGRIRPVAVSASQASLAVLRLPDGRVALDNMQQRRRNAPPTKPDQTWRHLRSIQLSGVTITLTDLPARATWQAAIAKLTLRDLDTAAVTGLGDATLRAHGQSSRLTVTLTRITAPAGGAVRQINGTFSAFNPAAFGTPMLAALNLPIAGGLQLLVGADWQPRRAALALHAGAGTIAVAGGALPIAGGTAQLQADAATHRITLTAARLVLVTPGPVLTATGTIEGNRSVQHAALGLNADRIAFADLARYWPPQAGHDPRAWVTANITQGVASQAHFDLALTIANGTLRLTRATGHLLGQDLTLAWLRPAPPLTHLNAMLTLLSPDAISISIPTAVQAPSDPQIPPLVLSDATLRITGLTSPVQPAAIEANLAGPMAQAIALLKEPRLHLLARHNLNVGTPAGTITAHLQVQLPLDAGVTMDQVGIHANGTLSNLHLGSLIAGKDLDQGQISLLADNNGLSLNGPAQLAGIPSNLAVRMDFRAGPPDQVVASYGASGSASAAQLQAAGLLAGGLIDGSVAYSATVLERRDGSGQARAHVDLRAASLKLTTLGWQKARDTDTLADATVQLQHDQVVAIDHLTVRGPNVDVAGRATYANGQAVALVFDRIDLGNTRAAGTVRFATATDRAVYADLHGDMLDLGTRLQPAAARPTPDRAQAQAAARLRRSAANTAAQPGRPWKADLRFRQVLLGPGHVLRSVVAHAENDGLLIQRAQVSGQAGRGSFRMTLAPQGSTRRLQGQANDAGGLLQALDLTGAVRGGALRLDGAYDDTQPDHPLVGTVSADRFRIVGAPAVARLLQAVTLYGLVDVLRGPGLGITHLVAPFRFAESVLTLQDGARAYSSSLGITASGEIDLAAQRADLTGTIVPGYFFNTLPGKLPVLGKLFSPEKGGGVFSGTYKLSGPLADPRVQVNPLAAFTPGFLRGVFGGAPPPSPPAKPAS